MVLIFLNAQIKTLYKIMTLEYFYKFIKEQVIHMHQQLSNKDKEEVV